MAKYEPKQPVTPKEIKVPKQEKKIAFTTIAMSMGFYIAIFIFVPEVPNSDFYLMLDSFLNSYCLGDIMPKFSPDFHFAMKVAWCLSLPYSLLLVLIFAFCIHTLLGTEEYRIFLQSFKDDMNTAKVRIILFSAVLCLIFAGFFFSIALYAFNISLRRGGQGIEETFHGNFIESILLFLFLHVFFVRGGIYALMLQLYCIFFVKKN